MAERDGGAPAPDREPDGGAPVAEPAPDGPSDGRPQVEVVGLTRRFGDFTAVDDLTFSVETGEIFGFLGPNGAGKTTTIKMLTGLLPPTEGEGRVTGLDIREGRAAIRERIGYMSQKFSLYADLTVQENIELFAGLYGVTGDRFRRRKAWILEMSELTDAEARLTGDLPLGWKQRLALGCAVLHEPPILFLDEPTSGVDPIARRRFWDLIDGMSEAGTTVFVSTHYMEEAENCHRLALLNRGRLVALDTPSNLRHASREVVLRLETTEAPRAVAALEGAPGIVEAAMHGRAVHVTVEDPTTGPERVRSVLAGEGIDVGGLVPVEPSLEDVFTSLVRSEGGAVVG